MTQPLKAVPVTDRVYWVGAVDWGIREFHGYATSRGTTYNAFLVMGDRVTLIDTVKPHFYDEMMSRVASVTDPGAIDLVVSNHSEMDHSGSLPRILDAVVPSRVVASKNGVRALDAHFGLGDRVEAVAEGDTLDLGGLTLTFLETKMLHWPDSMVSYLAEEQVLFSQDAFGMHLATRQLWADEIPEPVRDEEAAKYYANILLPFSALVAKKVADLAAADLPLAVLAPDHGPLYRTDHGRILEQYARWAEMKPTRKALVVYDTMWQSDTTMAKAVVEGLAAAGCDPVRVLPMAATHRSDVATEVLDAGALVLGSPTINNQLFPTMADILCYLEGLKRKHLVGAAFGSYGWSGESVKLLEAALERLGIERVAESVKIRYVPDAEALEACAALGQAVGEACVARAEA